MTGSELLPCPLGHENRGSQSGSWRRTVISGFQVQIQKGMDDASSMPGTFSGQSSLALSSPS